MKTSIVHNFLVLSGTATFLDHLKIFDPDSGEILLFVLVLTPKSLEVYKVHKVKFVIILFFIADFLTLSPCIYRNRRGWNFP